MSEFPNYPTLYREALEHLQDLFVDGERLYRQQTQKSLALFHKRLIVVADYLEDRVPQPQKKETA